MKETILLIEDEIELQQNLKEILEFNGFTVFTADNGEYALAILENQNIDLILCDIMMPVLGGYQFLKIIRNQVKYQNTPFIFLSAKASKEDKLKGQSGGSDDYLTKPVPARVLLNSIFNVLNEKKQKGFLFNINEVSSVSEECTAIEAEVKTPVNDLISILELLKQTVDPIALKETARLIDLAMFSARRIHLSFGKLTLYKSMSKLSPTTGPVFLNEVILDQIKEFGAEKFKFRSESSICPVFDLDLIKFVLKELMGNALIFNSGSHQVQVDWFGRELSIKNRQSIFKYGDTVKIEPFFQPKGEPQKNSGLGLGLFLVSEICKINQTEFHCWIDSDVEFTAKILF